MSSKIAYLITYITYNCVYNKRGSIDESLLEKFLLDNISEYIINNSFSSKFEVVDDIKQFWEKYNGYNVWEAYCVKDDMWIDVKPSNEEILLNIYEMTKSVETLNAAPDTIDAIASNRIIIILKLNQLILCLI